MLAAEIPARRGVSKGWSLVLGFAAVNLPAGILWGVVEARVERSPRLTAWFVTAKVRLGLIEEGTKERILMRGDLSRSEFAALNDVQPEARAEMLSSHLMPY